MKIEDTKIVLRSPAEVEYKSMANAVSKLVWTTALSKELGHEVEEPTMVFSDSRATLQIAVNPAFHERTKHKEIDCHFIR